MKEDTRRHNDAANPLPSCIRGGGKKVLFLGLYFGFLPIFLLFLIIYQLFLSHQTSSFTKFSFTKRSIEYKALPETKQETVASVVPQEGRVDVLTEFFSKYKSPLAKYSKLIVDTADKYDIDYRLIPAIAMQESTLCKKIIANSHNCWGFGIYGKKVTKFPSFDEAIETVTKTLAHNYIQKGLQEPDEIMSKYTPSNNGEWAENVSFIMEKIESSL